MTTPRSSPWTNSFWKWRCHFPSRTTWVYPQPGHWYGFADTRECPMTAPRCLPAGGDFGLDMSLFLKEFRGRTVVCPLTQAVEVLLHLCASPTLHADDLRLHFGAVWVDGHLCVCTLHGYVLLKPTLCCCCAGMCCPGILAFTDTPAAGSVPSNPGEPAAFQALICLASTNRWRILP